MYLLTIATVLIYLNLIHGDGKLVAHALNFSVGTQAITSKISQLSNLFQNVPSRTPVPESFSASQSYDHDLQHDSVMDPWEFVKQTVVRELDEQNIDVTSDMFTHESPDAQDTKETTFVQTRLEQHLINQLQKIIYHLNVTQGNDNASKVEDAKQNSSLDVVRTTMLSEVALLIVHLCQYVDVSRRVFTENITYIHVLLAILILFTCSVAVTNVLAGRNASKSTLILLESSSSNDSYRTDMLTDHSSSLCYKHFEENGVHKFCPLNLIDAEEVASVCGTDVWILNDTKDKFLKWIVHAKVQNQSVEYYTDKEQTPKKAQSKTTPTTNTRAVTVYEDDGSNHSKRFSVPAGSPRSSKAKGNLDICSTPVRSPTTPVNVRRRNSVQTGAQSSEKKSPTQSGMLLRNGKETPRKPINR